MLLRYLILVLETIFFVGLAGSLVVAIMAFVGDLHVFFDRDEAEEKPHGVRDVPRSLRTAPHSTK